MGTRGDGRPAAPGRLPPARPRRPCAGVAVPAPYRLAAARARGTAVPQHATPPARHFAIDCRPQGAGGIRMRRGCWSGCSGAGGPRARPANDRPNNILLFVADGLRPGMVDERTAPAMTALMQPRRELHQQPFAVPDLHHRQRLGDGDRPLSRRHRRFQQHASMSASRCRQRRRQRDAVSRERRRAGRGRRALRGRLPQRGTILKLARDAGFSTAAIGKLGPALIFDHTERTGTTDHHRRRRDRSAAGGMPLSRRAPSAAGGLPAQTRPRETARPQRQARSGHQSRATGLLDRRRHQGGVAAVQGARQAVRAGLLVARSRRHPAPPERQPRPAVPGINGPSSLAAIRNADDSLARLLAALKEQGLEARPT